MEAFTKELELSSTSQKCRLLNNIRSSLSNVEVEPSHLVKLLSVIGLCIPSGDVNLKKSAIAATVVVLASYKNSTLEYEEGLEMLISVLNRLTSVFTLSPKEEVVESAHRCVQLIFDMTISNERAITWVALSLAHQHPNVQLAAMVAIVEASERLGEPFVLPLAEKFTSKIIGQMKGTSGAVRDSAPLVLKAFYLHKPELRSQIQSSRDAGNIFKADYEKLISMLNQVDEEGEVILKSTDAYLRSLAVVADLAVESASSSNNMVHSSSSTSLSSNSSGKMMQKSISSSTLSSGVKAIATENEDDAKKHLSELHTSFTKIGSHDWEGKVALLKRLQGLILGEIYKHKNFATIFKPFIQEFNNLCKEIRAALLDEVTKTIALLSESAGEIVAIQCDKLMQYLLPLLHSKSAVIVEHGDACIISIIRCSHPPNSIPLVCHEISKSQHIVIRNKCVNYLNIFINEGTKEFVDKHIDIIRSAIKSGCEDSNGEVRQESRRCFSSFHKRWNDQGILLWEQFGNEVKKALNSEGLVPVSNMSASSSSSSLSSSSSRPHLSSSTSAVPPPRSTSPVLIPSLSQSGSIPSDKVAATEKISSSSSSSTFGTTSKTTAAKRNPTTSSSRTAGSSTAVSKSIDASGPHAIRMASHAPNMKAPLRIPSRDVTGVAPTPDSKAAQRKPASSGQLVSKSGNSTTTNSAVATPSVNKTNSAGVLGLSSVSKSKSASPQSSPTKKVHSPNKKASSPSKKASAVIHHEKNVKNPAQVLNFAAEANTTSTIERASRTEIQASSSSSTSPPITSTSTSSSLLQNNYAAESTDTTEFRSYWKRCDIQDLDERYKAMDQLRHLIRTDRLPCVWNNATICKQFIATMAARLGDAQTRVLQAALEILQTAAVDQSPVLVQYVDILALPLFNVAHGAWRDDVKQAAAVLIEFLAVEEPLKLLQVSLKSLDTPNAKVRLCCIKAMTTFISKTSAHFDRNPNTTIKSFIVAVTTKPNNMSANTDMTRAVTALLSAMYQMLGDTFASVVKSNKFTGQDVLMKSLKIGNAPSSSSSSTSSIATKPKSSIVTSTSIKPVVTATNSTSSNTNTSTTSLSNNPNANQKARPTLQRQKSLSQLPSSAKASLLSTLEFANAEHAKEMERLKCGLTGSGSVLPTLVPQTPSRVLTPNSRNALRAEIEATPNIILAVCSHPMTVSPNTPSNFAHRTRSTSTPQLRSMKSQLALESSLEFNQENAHPNSSDGSISSQNIISPVKFQLGEEQPNPDEKAASIISTSPLYDLIKSLEIASSKDPIMKEMHTIIPLMTIDQLRVSLDDEGLLNVLQSASGKQMPTSTRMLAVTLLYDLKNALDQDWETYFGKLSMFHQKLISAYVNQLSSTSAAVSH